MAALTACEALLPLAEAALNQGGFALPPELSGRRALLKIGDSAGILFIASQGQGHCELWRGSRPAPNADATISFDSLESLRKLLQDPNAFPMLLLRRKLRLQGDSSFLQAMQSPGASPAETAMVKELVKELDQAIGRALEQDPLDRLDLVAPCSAAWVPNDASDVCMECSKEFGILRRRHHCRACGRLLCSECCPKVPLNPDAVDINCFTFGGQNRSGVRICSACDSNGALPIFSGASTAAPSRRASIASTRRPSFMPRPSTFSDMSETSAAGGVQSSFAAATEAAAERLKEVKEELSALHEAERKRKERSIRSGVQQIWLATHILLASITVGFLFWRISVAAAWVALLTVLWHSEESSMIARNVRVFWTAAVVTVFVYKTKWKLRATGETEGEDYDAEWTATHELLGRFIFLQILKLKGFWIKLGQQLSVNVVLAAPYRAEFSKLQDKIPPMPVSDVLKTLREEFGAEAVAELDIDSGAPLGTASIAQVHKAIWRPKGAAHQEVVVKVQHRGVDRQFRQDLRNARILSWLLAMVDPEGVPDLRPIIQSLREVTLNELDFRLEAENQVRARSAAEKWNARVVIPQVLPKLIGKKAMAMEFIAGEPLGKASERLSQEQRNRLIADMVDHFAVQFAVDGHFHADPHPGNLLLEKDTDRLVVLDWGMCITLSPEKTDAYARAFVSASTSNVWGLVQAMLDMGLKFKAGDTFEPLLLLNFFRFALRETQPVDEAKGQIEGFIKASDDLYWKGPQRFKKSPFDVFTGDMTYFFKALDLLWCVSSQLHARHPILTTMFLRSLVALRGVSPGSPAVPRTLADVMPEPAVTSCVPGHLADSLRDLLLRSFSKGHVLGAQLCVLELGSRPAPLVDLALGRLSWTDSAPVTPATQFNLLDISKLIVAMAVLRLVEAGRLKLEDQLPKRNGGQVTVEQVLSHRAGLWQPLPDSILYASQLLDTTATAAAWRQEAPREAPGASQRYHHISFGYLLDDACRELAGCSLEKAWAEVADIGAATARELGFEGEPLRVRAEGAARVQGEPTTSGMEEVGDMMARIYNLLGEEGEASPSTSSRSPVDGTAKQVFGRDHLLHPSLFSGAPLPNKEAGPVSNAFMPGLQGFGTARQLVSLLAAAESERVLRRQTLEDMLRSRRTGAPGADIEELAAELQHVLSLEEFTDFGLGAQLVDIGKLRNEASGHLQSLDSFVSAAKDEAWGHLSQVGSMALLLPGERPVAVALLLNLSSRGRCGQKVASDVLQAIAAYARR